MDPSSAEHPHLGDTAERLLQDSWEARGKRASRRELVAELTAGALFLAAASALLAQPEATAGFSPAVAALLVAMYALVARVEFPVGAGHVVPTQLVLVPMLVLLPPATVPLLAVAGLMLGALWDWARGRGRAERLLFSIPDGWHAIGPAAVLLAAGSPALGFDDLPLLGLAFVAGALVDFASATLREAVATGVAPRVQVKVIALVWVVDACLAPVGLLAAVAAEQGLVAVMLVLPLGALLLMLARDRSTRIEQAHQRLELVRQERSRLQSAVQRLGDAFAAKLDLEALLDIVLRGSIEALDASAGRLELSGPEIEHRLEFPSGVPLPAALHAAAWATDTMNAVEQVEHDGNWVLALPFAVGAPFGELHGMLSLARPGRQFQADETAVATRLIERAQTAAADILSHHELQSQVVTDPLTGLGNRRKLFSDLGGWLQSPEAMTSPSLLMMFDLDGFKTYNDSFGHSAGDALLARLGAKLAAAAAAHGDAYRLGGDEFCVLLRVDVDGLDEMIAAVGNALTEDGDEFTIGASCGVVLLPHEGNNPDRALQLADERMYARKHGRSGGARAQARDVLVHTMRVKQPNLDEHSGQVAELAVRVARRLGVNGEELDEIRRAADLHDVGKVGIPDAILNKPGPLNAGEWDFIRQHTILGERILAAAPAMRPVARIVRATHERWDGRGYPDGLRGEQIPLAARIVAVCDAYQAMTGRRAYRVPMGQTAAFAKLRAGAGSQFDLAVVDAFLAEVNSAVTDILPSETSSSEIAAHVRELLSHSPAAA
jgi:diguanylate cyclase (GGDEF)-like protein